MSKTQIKIQVKKLRNIELLFLQKIHKIINKNAQQAEKKLSY